MSFYKFYGQQENTKPNDWKFDLNIFLSAILKFTDPNFNVHKSWYEAQGVRRKLIEMGGNLYKEH